MGIVVVRGKLTLHRSVLLLDSLGRSIILISSLRSREVIDTYAA